MCGILGQVLNTLVDSESFKKKLNTLNHRGPNDSGVYIDKNIALGQTRLSIIDLSENGHQPMNSSCGKYTIIYNGEIYNFDEIRKDLLLKSYRFHSKSDTEVILNGFIEYKEKILNKLNGMFSFAIYNKYTKEVFLARDRSGIKPLYYKNKETFTFSSELKAIKKHSDRINIDAKILFLLLGYIPEPLTIYKDILSLPAGHYAYYRNSELEIKKFDEYEYVPKVEKDYEDIVDDVSHLFDQSIKRHLISDAPIGSFLSGGLDSSIITAIAVKYKPDLQTLSLVFNEKELSEEYYQDLVVEKYATKHTKYLVDENLFMNTFPDFIESIDQPTIDGLNTYFVSKAAKEAGLKAVLSGVGGDEIFYGYPSFKDGKTLSFLSKIPYWIIKVFEFSNKYKKLELLQAEKELSFYLPKRALFSPKEISNILKVDIEKIYELIANLWKVYNSSKIKDIEDKISYYELSMYMKNQLLKDTDVFGMKNSLEIRVPFLDKDLVNYVLRVDPKNKFGKNNKQLLADISKNILPDEVINRQKMGFTLPFEYWFRKNIDNFDIDKNIKQRFKDKELQWARFWAIFVMERFHG